MEEKKKFNIGQYTAEVLDESRYVFYLDSTLKILGRMTEHPTSLTKANIEALKADALAKGYDTVCIGWDRYVCYTLYHIMRNRSGWFKKTTIYKHTHDGKWTKKMETKNATY